MDDQVNSGAVEEAGLLLADPATYAEPEVLHEALRTLRKRSPVHRVEAEGFNPFWAITRHHTLTAVERDNDRFINSPRPILQPADDDRLRAERGSPMRSLVHMDEPDHRTYRALTAEWFTPRALRSVERDLDDLAGRWVDRMAELGGECDFASDVAMHFPLYVILSILGLPESDFPLMLRLTQEMFGEQDPAARRGASAEERRAVFADFFAYFGDLVAERRRTPTEDLASVLANARIDGELVDDMALMSYLVLIATAGHDTTSATLSGGLKALAERPDQLELLRKDPPLIASAVEEMLRWESPVKQFVRTATQDSVVDGVPIAAGEALLLSYPSANRDEDVFAAPFAFDVTRRPNPHRAFGVGVHACLGAQLARLELRAFFTVLIPRLRQLALAGRPTYARTLFVGGARSLPVAYDLADGR